MKLTVYENRLESSAHFETEQGECIELVYSKSAQTVTLATFNAEDPDETFELTELASAQQ